MTFNVHDVRLDLPVIFPNPSLTYAPSPTATSCGPSFPSWNPGSIQGLRPQSMAVNFNPVVWFPSLLPFVFNRGFHEKPTTFMFRDYNPYIRGLKPFIFHGFWGPMVGIYTSRGIQKTSMFCFVLCLQLLHFLSFEMQIVKSEFSELTLFDLQEVWRAGNEHHFSELARKWLCVLYVNIHTFLHS